MCDERFEKIEKIDNSIERLDNLIREFIVLGEERGIGYEEEIDYLLDIRNRYNKCKEMVKVISEKREKMERMYV